ncbi:MAG: tetratricopeptide repeat protein [Thermoplasmata archaeon]|uniref:Tetratricopeptide repeat protein n=1 Tax=Candidatus Sysuiplasma superficiale TaxID=2823368 RepID=A0A8J8CDA4_9ARCH|nr:tetratricopeptide repeat protein [Candidatus Sysuiplasma superficiale]
MRSDQMYWEAEAALARIEREIRSKKITSSSRVRDRKLKRMYALLMSCRNLNREEKVREYAHLLGRVSFNSGNSVLAVRFFRLLPREMLTGDAGRMFFESLLSERKLAEAEAMLADGAFTDSPGLHHLLQGRLLCARGNHEEARKEFRKALQLNDRDIQSIELLLNISKNPAELKELTRLKADYMMSRGHSRQAVKLYNILLKTDTDSPGLLRSAGIAYADAGNYRKARMLLDASLKAECSPETSAALGFVEAKLGMYEKALGSFSTAMEGNAVRQPEMLISFCRVCVLTKSSDRATRAIQRLKDARDEEIRKNIPALADIAYQASERGLNDVALEASELAIAHGQKDRRTLAVKLDALLSLKRFEEALQFIHENFRNREEVREEMMTALLGTGRIAEAASVADRIIARDRENSAALYVKCLALDRSGKTDDVFSNYAETVVRRGDARVLQLLLEISKREGRDSTVLKCAQALLSMGDESQHTLYDKAVALERLGRLRDSELCFRKAFRKSGSIESLERLSSFYARHDMKGREERLLSDALNMNQEMPSGLVYRLAKIKLENGDAAGSLKILEGYLKRKETPEGRYIQAAVLLKLGRYDESVEAAERSMKLGYPAKFAEASIAEALCKLGKDREALMHYDLAIKSNTTDPSVYVGRAKLLWSMGRVDEAAAEFSLVENMFGEDIMAQEECARFYYETGQFQKCVKASESIIKRERENSKAWRIRGLSLAALKRYDDAVSSLEACRQKDREVLTTLKNIYAAKNDSMSAVKTIDSIIKDHGESRELLIEKGRILENEGKRAEALAAYELSIDRFGPDESSITSKCRILHSEGKYQEEVKILLEAMKNGLESAAILSTISEAYAGMGRYADALEYADRAMKAEPESPSHMNLRGRILMALQQYSEAERSVDVALMLNPKDPAGLELKGNILMQEGNYSQALDVLNGALAAGISNGRIYRCRAECLLHEEKYQEALDSYGRALKMEPDKTEMLLGKGICEYKTEKYSSATMTLNEFTKRDPGNAKGWYYLGLSLSKQRIGPEARKAFEESVRLEPSFAPALLELGRIYLEEGHYEKAFEHLSKILQAEPENSEARELFDNCRTMERKIKGEENAKTLLKLEYEMDRIPTREEAFSVCRIPMDEIDDAFEAIQEPTSLTVPMIGDPGWETLEQRSAEIMMKCFRNIKTASLGLRLCDIVYNFPTYSLEEAKQSFEYIRKVQQMNLLEGIEDARFEKLMKKATRLKAGERNLIGIVTNLNVGIYTGRLILGSLAAMGKSGYRPDYVVVSPPVESGVQKEYDTYDARRELMEQYYGKQGETGTDYAGSVEENSRCLYHGAEAIGECSACQTNLCEECVSATGGCCPNCGVVLMNEAGESANPSP